MTQNEFNPYVGPRPFERKAEDSARFFGRSQETEEIVSLIFGHPVTLVYAQSGAGKTSLFNASITLKLEENGFDVLPLTRVGGVVPKGITIKEIENLYVFNALLKIDSTTDPRTLLSKTLPGFLEMRVRATDESGQPNPRAIIFDQFEELFTYTPEHWREQREGFFSQVVEALKADPLLRVVFVIREDFLAELDPYARDLPERLRIRYRLERLGENAALHAIKDPLANTSRKFAPGVAERLVKELLAMRTVDATGKTAEVEGQYVEPVQLQVVCVTLWFALKPEITEIQESHLKNFNVNDALSDFYKSTIEAAAKETGVPETKLRNWFGKILITPMGTRSTVFRSEHSTGGIPNSTVDFLESRHIIRAEIRAGARWYELTHDRLVEPILANNQKWLETLSPLQRQATLWNDQGKHETWLLSDQALVEVEQWAKEHENELTDIEKEFLKECQTHQKEKEQRQQGRQRRLIANFSIVTAIITLALAVFGFVQAGFARSAQAEAEANAFFAQTERANSENNLMVAETAKAQAESEQARAAEQLKISRAGELAAQAQRLITENLQSALLLGIEAFRKFDTPQSRSALLDTAIASPQLLQFLPGHTGTVSSVAYSPDGKILASGSYDNTIILWDMETRQPIGQPLKGHTDDVSSVAFSPDGKILASASGDTTIMLWDVETHKRIDQLKGHSSYISSVAFSPDGKILASGSYDNSIILWNVETREQIIRFDLTSYVSTVTFSPDGRILASGSGDNTIILWNLETRRPIDRPLTGHLSSVTAVAFSPDGNILASGSYDNKIILWDVKTRQSVGQPLVGHASLVNTVAFSPDGRTLVSGSFDNTIIQWDVSFPEAPYQIAKLSGNRSAVSSVAFSPDGKTITSGGNDGTIILWNAGMPRSIGQPLTELPFPVSSVAFRADGRTLASGSYDGTIILWDIETRQSIDYLMGHTDAVSSVAFNTDGKILASGSYDNTVVLWDVETRKPIGQPLKGHANYISSVAFSPDGKTLASSGGDNTISLWSVETRRSIGQLTGDTNAVFSIAFSPDGKIVASGGCGEIRDDTCTRGEITLWDVETRQPIGQLAGHTSYISSVTFSPDGTALASGSYDNTIILWDIETGRPKGQPLTGHSFSVSSVAFSPDGGTLASGSYDNTIILWDVETRQPIGQPLVGHTSLVYTVAFSSDGEILASGSDDTSIVLWDVNPESWITLACQRAGRNFTLGEWERYFPGEKYQKTCEQWSLELEAGPTTIPTETQVISQATATITSIAIPATATITSGTILTTATRTPTAIPATATQIPSRTPTATPTVTITYRVINVVEDDVLNLRAGPGTKYDVLTKIPYNGRGIQVIGAGIQVDNAIWLPVIYNGISGWVNSYWLAPE